MIENIAHSLTIGKYYGATYGIRSAVLMLQCDV
jgi:hypothetical protein